METQRPWGWNREEMRDACAMEPQQAAQADHHPMINFTPINFPRTAGALEQPININDPCNSKAEEKTKNPKRRKTQSSVTTSLTKQRKPAGAKKVRTRKTAGELQCQDISKSLPRIKLTPSGTDMSFVKTATPSELVLSQPRFDVDLTIDARAKIEDQGALVSAYGRLRPSGLVDKYQTSYANQKDSDDPRNLAIHHSGTELSGRFETSDYGNDVFEDFMLPTSAQVDNDGDIRRTYNTKKGLDPLESFHFNSNEVFSDNNEADDFPMNDEGLEEFMQPIDPIGAYGEQQYIDRQLHRLIATPLISEDIEGCPARNGLMLAPSRSPTGAAIENVPTNQDQERLFDDDELDEDLVDFMVDGSDIVQPRTPLTSPEKPPSSPKLQWMPPKTFNPAKSSQISVSPIEVPHIVPVNEDGQALPFTRPPFHNLIRDRSPILGLSNRVVLRTCFRIGEALNAAAVASRANTDAIVELYARIILSERGDGFRQSFQLGDLFTSKPPYLSGTYSLWKGVALWDHDSKVFLGERGRGKMARVMGRIKRCEQGGGCEMTVLSIWEVDWEDVGVAKGIVCS